MGEPASIEIGKLAEYGSTLNVTVNDKQILLPKFASVGGSLQSEFYDIHQGDAIEILSYYTVRQVAEFMDVILEPKTNLYVNNKRADMDTPVYDNFTVQWSMKELHLSDIDEDSTAETGDISGDKDTQQPEPQTEYAAEADDSGKNADMPEQDAGKNGIDNTADDTEKIQNDEAVGPVEMQIIVNDSPVILNGKSEYVFVDVFEYIDFDLSKPQGRGVATLVNGREAEYMEPLHNGDVLKIYWIK